MLFHQRCFLYARNGRIHSSKERYNASKIRWIIWFIIWQKWMFTVECVAMASQKLYCCDELGKFRHVYLFLQFVKSSSDTSHFYGFCQYAAGYWTIGVQIWCLLVFLRVAAWSEQTKYLMVLDFHFLLFLQMSVVSSASVLCKCGSLNIFWLPHLLWQIFLPFTESYFTVNNSSILFSSF